MKNICLIFCLTGITLQGFGQCMQTPLSLGDRIENSDAVIEGRIIGKECFYDASGGKIFTKNYLEPSRVFKGTFNNNIRTIITEGGSIGDKVELVYPELELEIQNEGLFFLIEGERGLIPYGANQGFVKFNSGKGEDLFNVYEDLKKELFPEIITSTGEGKLFFKLSSIDATAITERAVPIISILSPLELRGGRQEVLTILGSGFGNERLGGFVSFKNADDGGLKFIDVKASEYYVSWKDSEIKIKVPSSKGLAAGSGKVKVTLNDSSNITSVSSIVIQYSRAELIYNNEIIAPDLVSINNEGGYTFRLNEDLYNNAGAKRVIEKIFNKWRCETGINFLIGFPTTIDFSNDQAGDDVNLIMFDEKNSLAAGVLAKTNIFFSRCLDRGKNQLFASEMDITFRKNLNWNFSDSIPTGFQYDFESVVLHEVGHALLLKHIIDPDKVMHFSLSPGDTERILSQTSEVPGAKDVLNSSVNFSNGCAIPNMSGVESGVCQFIYAASGNEDLIAFPNPSRGTFNLNIDLDITSKFYIKITDLMGRIVSEMIVENHQYPVYELVLDRPGVFIAEVEVGNVKKTFRLVNIGQ